MFTNGPWGQIPPPPPHHLLPFTPSAFENIHLYFRKDQYGPHCPLQWEKKTLKTEGRAHSSLPKPARSCLSPLTLFWVISSLDSALPCVESLSHASHHGALQQDCLTLWPCSLSTGLTSRLAPGVPGCYSSQIPCSRPCCPVFSRVSNSGKAHNYPSPG